MLARPLLYFLLVGGAALRALRGPPSRLPQQRTRASQARYALADDMRELQKAKQAERARTLASGGTPVHEVLESLEADCRRAAAAGRSEVNAVFLDFVGDTDAVLLAIKQSGLVVVKLAEHEGALIVTLRW